MKNPNELSAASSLRGDELQLIVNLSSPLIPRQGLYATMTVI